MEIILGGFWGSRAQTVGCDWISVLVWKSANVTHVNAVVTREVEIDLVRATVVDDGTCSKAGHEDTDEGKTDSERFGNGNKERARWRIRMTIMKKISMSR